MNKRRRRIIMLCVIIFAGAVSLVCERSAVEIYDPQLNIYSVLHSDHASQSVIVDRTYRMDEPAGPVIDDALVILSSWSSVDTLTFDQGSDAYWTYNLILQPLTEYSLMVWRDGFDTLYARTTLPGPFTILYPEHFDTVTFSDTVVLTKSDHAAVYAVSFGDEFGMFFEPPDTSDSLMIIPLAEVFSGWSPGNFFCRLWVAACDSNFYRYYDEMNNDPDVTGIDGGVGLFGSLWIESVDMFVSMVDAGKSQSTHTEP
ncbi:MAG: hypothetical protein JSW02_05445 [candidate division WOR-3 bacterium]|nr:MAG: hypothetical protein JSW02_05445 [candidate division WOR-3 bacterium]